MIFGHENISTYTRSNMAVWFTLALQAGLLNMGGFMACRTFVSHVTGIASLVSFEIESGNQTQSFGLLLLLLSFLLGAMASGLLVDLRMKLGKKPKYYIVFGSLFLASLITAICGLNNVFGDFGKPLSDLNGYALALLLCFTCGLQNGTVALVSKSVVRTTHLTGITTDLGIGIIRFLNRDKLENMENEGKANLMRIGIILFFILGSMIAVPIFQFLEFRGFILPCIISGALFILTLYFHFVKR